MPRNAQQRLRGYALWRRSDQGDLEAGPAQCLHGALFGRVVGDELVDVLDLDDPGQQVAANLGPVGYDNRATSSADEHRVGLGFDRVMGGQTTLGADPV